jgi:murein DD-endopeptidase MepM/ murein hydrolase activator NlpD
MAGKWVFDKSSSVTYAPSVFSMNPIDGIRKAAVHRAVFGDSTSLVLRRSSTVRSISIATNSREKLLLSAEPEYPIYSASGEVAIDDISSTDIYRFGWRLQEKLTALGHTIHTAFLVVATFCAHYINVAAYHAYIATVRAYRQVSHFPAYIQELQYQAVTFAQALRHADIRSLWLLDRKIRVRHIIQQCAVLAAQCYGILRVHYMAFFVTTCLIFLVMSGLHAKTGGASFLEHVAAHNFAATRTVLTADSNRGGARAVNDLSLAQSTSGITFISSHLVKSGDTFASLSVVYGVKPEIIAFNNSLSLDATVTPGSTLFIPATDAYIYFAQTDSTVADLSRIYKVAAADITELNPTLTENATVSKDSLVFIPIGSIDQIKQLNAEESDRISKEKAKEEALKAAEEASRRRATAISGVSYTVVTNIPGDLKTDIDFAWPTDSRNISCGWYCYPGHTAIDIQDTNESTPAIYASAGGYVTEVRTGDSPRSGNGYGNYIVVSHGDGYRTLYAHLSEVDVGVGQTVSKGAKIGNMGNTGNVYGITGIHLHFEIRKDNQIFNPATILP